VCGKDGKPLLSWRVLILPYLDNKPLYDRFKLDEPWDSPHNIKLLSEMPKSYEPPGYTKEKAPPYHTFIHVFYGNDAAFDWSKGKTIPGLEENIALDRNDDTFLFVEAGKPVPWTKPEDLPYDPDGPLPDLESPFKDGFRSSPIRGRSMRWIEKETSDATLRALISRDGSRQRGAER
jgi:hypothetical protein